MTAAAALAIPAISIERAATSLPILVVTGRDTIAIRAGTVVRIGDHVHAFEHDTPVHFDEPKAGCDYGVRMAALGAPVAAILDCAAPVDGLDFAGFHFAPGGNAKARSGGDEIAAINPASCWDAGFRPACPDPRGMALVDMPGRPFWADIYLLGASHMSRGTSRCGEPIADGVTLPDAVGGKPGKGKAAMLDHATAVAIYAHHGKQLLGAEEFFAAAFGVTERTVADDEPEQTGLDAARTSRFGLMQASGNMWVWGTDGDPDAPRPSLLGGSWISGWDAGSRCANLDPWPGDSFGSVSARGRSDHLRPE